MSTRPALDTEARGLLAGPAWHVLLCMGAGESSPQDPPGGDTGELTPGLSWAWPGRLFPLLTLTCVLCHENPQPSVGFVSSWDCGA